MLDQDPMIAGPSVTDKVNQLETLLATARSVGLDAHDPDDIDDLIDVIFDLDDQQEANSAFETLHRYIHFRIDTADNSEVWDDAHQIIEEILAEPSGEVDALAHAMESAEQLDPEERREALAHTRVVSAVNDLLMWVGTGRQASPSGGIRRNDIQQVAGMIGVSAIGVNKRPAREPELTPLFTVDPAPPDPSAIRALSIQDVPMLAAWWKALLLADVLETTATRVRAGAAAETWTSEPMPPHDLAEMVVGVFVAEVLTQGLGRVLVPFEEGIISEAIRLLLRALAPDIAEDEDDDESSGLEHLLLPRALIMLRQLELAGLLRFEEEEPSEVPVALRRAVARGVILAMTFLVGGREDGEEY